MNGGHFPKCVGVNGGRFPKCPGICIYILLSMVAGFWSDRSYCPSRGSNYAHPTGVMWHVVLIHSLRYDVRNDTLIGFTLAKDLEQVQERCRKEQ